MTRLIPRWERLKKHEVILPCIVILFMIGLFNGIRKFNEVNGVMASMTYFLSGIIWFFMWPLPLLNVKIRFTRPYNTFLWLIPSSILFGLYYWVASHPEFEKNFPNHTLAMLRLPLFSLLYKHLMRIVHIYLYNTEPQIDSIYGPLIIDDDLARETISSDKGFTVIEALGYGAILFICLILEGLK